MLFHRQILNGSWIDRFHWIYNRDAFESHMEYLTHGSIWKAQLLRCPFLELSESDLSRLLHFLLLYIGAYHKHSLILETCSAHRIKNSLLLNILWSQSKNTVYSLDKSGHHGLLNYFWSVTNHKNTKLQLSVIHIWTEICPCSVNCPSKLRSQILQTHLTASNDKIINIFDCKILKH